jgi:hypothetical protein
MMTKIAKIFNIPILTTEQNTKSFGETVPEIKNFLSKDKDIIIEKQYHLI